MTNTAAGITLFNPDIERLRDNVESLLPQTGRVYMIDNASGNISEVKALFADNDKIQITENKKNFGIAYALNQMCAAALADGYEWIITMDQDSVAQKDIIEKYSRYTDIDNAAIITPYFDDENEPDLIKSSIPVPFEKVHRCNTSASLTRLSAWEEIGGFDERMFIDCVDFDFCTSLEEAGYVIIRDNEAVVYHRLGHAREIRAFMIIGRMLNIKKLKSPMFTYNHSPERTYYYARNIRYYMHKHKDTINLFTERRVFLKWLVLKLFFEDNRLEKLKAVIRGRRDSKAMIRELDAQRAAGSQDGKDFSHISTHNKASGS